MTLQELEVRATASPGEPVAQAYVHARNLEQQITGIETAIAVREDQIRTIEAIRARVAEAFARSSPVGSRAAMDYWEILRIFLLVIDYGVGNLHETALPLAFDSVLREFGFDLATFPATPTMLRDQIAQLQKERAEAVWALAKILRD